MTRGASATFDYLGRAWNTSINPLDKSPKDRSTLTRRTTRQPRTPPTGSSPGTRAPPASPVISASTPPSPLSRVQTSQFDDNPVRRKPSGPQLPAEFELGGGFLPTAAEVRAALRRTLDSGKVSLSWPVNEGDHLVPVGGARPPVEISVQRRTRLELAMEVQRTDGPKGEPRIVKAWAWFNHPLAITNPSSLTQRIPEWAKGDFDALVHGLVAGFDVDPEDGTLELDLRAGLPFKLQRPIELGEKLPRLNLDLESLLQGNLFQPRPEEWHDAVETQEAPPTPDERSSLLRTAASTLTAGASRLSALVQAGASRLDVDEPYGVQGLPGGFTPPPPPPEPRQPPASFMAALGLLLGKAELRVNGELLEHDALSMGSKGVTLRGAPAKSSLTGNKLSLELDSEGQLELKGSATTTAGPLLADLKLSSVTAKLAEGEVTGKAQLEGELRYNYEHTRSQNLTLQAQRRSDDPPPAARDEVHVDLPDGPFEGLRTITSMLVPPRFKKLTPELGHQPRFNFGTPRLGFEVTTDFYASANEVTALSPSTELKLDVKSVDIDAGQLQARTHDALSVTLNGEASSLSVAKPKREEGRTKKVLSVAGGSADAHAHVTGFKADVFRKVGTEFTGLVKADGTLAGDAQGKPKAVVHATAGGEANARLAQHTLPLGASATQSYRVEVSGKDGVEVEKSKLDKELLTSRRRPNEPE
jgi:hypothetical protein